MTVTELDGRIRAATDAIARASTLEEQERIGAEREELLQARDALRLSPAGVSTVIPAPMAPSGTSGWETPVPFEAIGALPAFPVECLPRNIAEWVRAESFATQTPVDLAAMTTLAVLSASVAKKYRVEVRGGWREPLNIFAAVALAPGNRKSAVFNDAAEPLVRWEAEAIERERPALRDAAAKWEIVEGRLKEAKTRAIRAKGADRLVAEEDVRLLGEELESLPRPVALRLLADDTTPERLVGLLEEQGGRLAVLSPEGGIFDLIGGRYSANSLPNLDAFLKAHAGDDLRVDRVGRPGEQLKAPALTVGLAVQPDVIRGLSDRPGFRGRGLLARFLYSIPRSAVGARQIDPLPVPVAVSAHYAKIVRSLLDLSAVRDQDGEIVSSPLPLSRGAVETLHRFMGDLEPRLGDGGDLGAIADWASKLAGAVARIAGVLHLADCGESGSSGNPSPVPPEAVKRAIGIGDYLIPHALAAFGLMGTRPEVEDARYLLKWIERTHLDRFTKRGAWQGTRGRFTRAEDLDVPLRELEARGYVRREEEENRSGPGRKPSPWFAVNPATRSHNSHYPQNDRDAVGRDA